MSHRDAAKDWLHDAETYNEASPHLRQAWAQIAQVHATLALVEAVRALDKAGSLAKFGPG